MAEEWKGRITFDLSIFAGKPHALYNAKVLVFFNENVSA
jgi:hypothetical protein